MGSEEHRKLVDHLRQFAPLPDGLVPAFALVRYSPRPRLSVVWSEAWQTTAIFEAAAYFGLRIVETYTERLISGRKARSRPGLDRVQELAKPDEFGNPSIRALVVADWKRFSRDDPGRVLGLVSSLADAKVVVLSNAQRNLVPWDNPFYWAMAALYATEAQDEAKSTAQMASKAIREARAAGMDWGRAPIGWVRLGRVGEHTDPDERALARKRSHWVPDESDGPRSMEVLRQLYELRDSGRSWHYLTKVTGLFETSIRIALLGTPIATTDPSGRRKRVWPKPPERPSNWRNRDAVGADLYDRVIDRGTAGLPVITRRQPWLFRSLIHCPFDGSRMSGRDSVHRGLSNRYYVCSCPRPWPRAQQAARARSFATTPVDRGADPDHPWTHVREDRILRALSGQLRRLDFDDGQVATMERVSRTPARRKAVSQNQARRRQLHSEMGLLTKAYVKGRLSEQDYDADYAERVAALAKIPPDPPGGTDDWVAQTVAGIRNTANLLPTYADIPKEVELAMPILRRLVTRIDLTSDRQPIFRWTPPVEAALALARSLGFEQEPTEMEEGRDWMSPREVGEALARGRREIEGGLEDRIIPAERIVGPSGQTRYRIPRKWVEERVANPQPLRRRPTTSTLSPKQAAERLGMPRRTVVRLIRKGVIKAPGIGEGRHTRYSIPPEAIQTQAVVDAAGRSRARAVRRSLGRIRTNSPDGSEAPPG
jgi:excisionase family DNA binding protein